MHLVEYLGDMVGLNPPIGEPGVMGSKAELELELQTEVQCAVLICFMFHLTLITGMLFGELKINGLCLVVEFPQKGMLPKASNPKKSCLLLDIVQKWPWQVHTKGPTDWLKIS